MSQTVMSVQLEAGHVLDSFAIQLVCLAIWKESLHACLTWAAAAAEENGQQPYSRGGAHEADHEASAATACSVVEREFSVAVDRAEDLASQVTALDGMYDLTSRVGHLLLHSQASRSSRSFYVYFSAVQCMWKSFNGFASRSGDAH